MLDIKNGQRFGFLTVISEADRKRKPNGASYRVFNVKCDCGVIKTVALSSLSEGVTVSCGCFHKKNAKDIFSKSNTTHGQSETRLYWVWKAMKGRCTNPNNKSYQRYGARGISVCKEWMDSFESFYEHVGPRPDGMTLDRIDTFKGYEPGNVRWATYKQQARNTRRNVKVFVDGKEMILIEATEALNINYENTRRALKTKKSVNGVTNG